MSTVGDRGAPVSGTDALAAGAVSPALAAEPLTASIQDAAVPATAQATAPGDGLRDTTLKVLGAGAAGLGTLGVVTGVGGAIMFERFSQAGLPAEQAVAVQSHTVLLAVGAEALIPLAVTTLLVLALYWRLTAKIPRPLLAALGGAGAILYYLIAVGFAPKAHVLVEVALATAIVCTAWTWMAGHTTRQDVHALLLAVGTMALGCAIGLIRTIDAPKVRGAVVVLSHPARVVAGIYVAENSEQVYLGQVELANSYDDEPKAGSGAIIVLNRADVSAVALASNQGLPTALRQASLMERAVKEEPDGALLARRLGETRRERVVVETTSPFGVTRASLHPYRSRGGHAHSSAAATRPQPQGSGAPRSPIRHTPDEAIEPRSSEGAPAPDEAVEHLATAPAPRGSGEFNGRAPAPDEAIEHGATSGG
jgi:hypothetical protein